MEKIIHMIKNCQGNIGPFLSVSPIQCSDKKLNDGDSYLMAYIMLAGSVKREEGT